MKLRALRLIWVAAALLLAHSISASPMDEESKEIFKRLIAQHAPSVVRVSFVMKSSYQGQEQSQESSATGVVVDARGLILVPRMVVEPTFPGLDKLTNEQKASFKLESRDFRVRFAGQDTPMEAEALSADPDLGIAWLRLKPAKASALDESNADATQTKSPQATEFKAPYAAVDLGNDAAAAPGQAYYVIERMEDRYGGAPIVSWGVLVGEVSVPRRAHVATGAIGLGFSAEGKVLGFVVVDMESMNNDATMSGQGGMRMTMASAKRIASATQRAASLLEEP
jgi:hypothetical protein